MIADTVPVTPIPRPRYTLLHIVELFNFLYYTPDQNKKQAFFIIFSIKKMGRYPVPDFSDFPIFYFFLFSPFVLIHPVFNHFLVLFWT